MSSPDNERSNNEGTQNVLSKRGCTLSCPVSIENAPSPKSQTIAAPNHDSNTKSKFREGANELNMEINDNEKVFVPEVSKITSFRKRLSQSSSKEINQYLSNSMVRINSKRNHGSGVPKTNGVMKSLVLNNQYNMP